MEIKIDEKVYNIDSTSLSIHMQGKRSRFSLELAGKTQQEVQEAVDKFIQEDMDTMHILKLIWQRDCYNPGSHKWHGTNWMIIKELQNRTYR